MAAEQLRRLLDPRSIAFVGGRRALLAIEQCRRLGYDGDIWLVNPTVAELAGLGAYAALEALPAVPDAVFIGVDAAKAIEAVAAAARAGAGGAVVYAAGFAEAGPDGAALQNRLIEAAGRMPVIGPNCHGLVNAISGAALWPDVQGCGRVERGVAIVTQSGNLAIDLTMQQRGLPIAYVVTLGNQALVSIADCVRAVAADERVTAIGLHIEGIDDSTAFATSALAALDRSVPLVALKTGATDAGAAITSTHTASLAGPAPAHEALFRRYGIAQVETAEDLLGTLSVLHHHGRLPGTRLVSLSCSGGEASLMADLAPPRGVSFPPFDEQTARHLTELLDHRVSVANPLDYHTFIWGDQPRLTDVFTAALGSGVDAAILVIDFPAAELDDSDWWPTVNAFADASKRSGVPGLVTSTLPENLPAPVCVGLRATGLAPIPGVAACLAATAAAATPEPSRRELHRVPANAGSGVLLDEAAAKQFLAKAGLPVPPGTATEVAAAPRTAREIGFPVVIKSLAVAHRSDVGGVVVGLEDEEAVAAAAESMRRLGTAVLVERHVTGTVAELLVGVQNDAPVGWTLTVGAGGVLAELLDDTATLLLPSPDTEIEDALRSLRMWPLLAGHRARPPGAVGAAIAAITRVCELAVETSREIEVNPLLVGRDEVWIADALIQELV